MLPSWNLGGTSSKYFKVTLKSSLIIPVTNCKFGDLSNPGNYRPIFLLPTVSKLLEPICDLHLDNSDQQ